MSDAAFPPETFAYLAELKANNSRDWFEANRDRYERFWKAPALDFIAAVSGPLAALDPPLQAAPRLNASLRRINRDVRFSNDKSPYSPMLHLIFSTGGKFNKDAGMHLVLHADGVGYGAGLYGLDPAALKRYRDRVARPAEAAALEAALAAAAKVGCRMGEPELARAPAGYEAEEPAATHLRYKGIVVRTHGEEADPSVLTGPGAVDWTIETTKALLPVLDWLRRL